MALSQSVLYYQYVNKFYQFQTFKNADVVLIKIDIRIYGKKYFKNSRLNFNRAISCQIISVIWGRFIKVRNPAFEILISNIFSLVYNLYLQLFKYNNILIK